MMEPYICDRCGFSSTDEATIRTHVTECAMGTELNSAKVCYRYFMPSQSPTLNTAYFKCRCSNKDILKAHGGAMHNIDGEEAHNVRTQLRWSDVKMLSYYDKERKHSKDAKKD